MPIPQPQRPHGDFPQTALAPRRGQRRGPWRARSELEVQTVTTDVLLRRTAQVHPHSRVQREETKCCARRPKIQFWGEFCPPILGSRVREFANFLSANKLFANTEFVREHRVR